MGGIMVDVTARRWLDVDFFRLPIERHFHLAGLIDSRYVLIERGQVAAVFIGLGGGADEIHAWLQSPETIDAAVVGSDAIHINGRLRVTVNHHVVIGQTDVVFVHDFTGDGAKPRQPDFDLHFLRLFQHHRQARRFPLLLTVLRRGERAPRSRNKVCAGRQLFNCERAVKIGAHGFGRSRGSGHGACRHQRPRQRTAGLRLYHGALNDGGMEPARPRGQQNRQPSLHRCLDRMTHQRGKEWRRIFRLTRSAPNCIVYLYSIHAARTENPYRSCIAHAGLPPDCG
jgi:hypothetical protein